MHWPICFPKGQHQLHRCRSSAESVSYAALSAASVPDADIYDGGSCALSSEGNDALHMTEAYSETRIKDGNVKP